jgi:hypothetical protein
LKSTMTSFRFRDRAQLARKAVSVLTVVAALAVPVRLSGGEESPTSSADAVAGLLEKWRHQQAALQSVDIKYIEFQGAYTFPPQTREDVLRTFEAIDFSDPDRSIREFACGVSGVPMSANSLSYPRQRFEWSRGLTRADDGGAGRGVTVFDGQRVIQKAPLSDPDGPQQVTIGAAPGQMHLPLASVTDFRWLPNPERGGLTLSIEQAAADRWTLATESLVGDSPGPGTRWIVDPTTADVLSMQSVDPQGQVTREIVQRRFQDVGQGLRFPMVSMMASYAAGSLESLGVRVLLSVDASSTPAIPATVISARSGDIVVDHVSGDGRARRLAEDVPDVTQIPRPAVIVPWEEPDRGSLQWLLLVNGLVLLAIIALFMRRHGKRSSTQ